MNEEPNPVSGRAVRGNSGTSLLGGTGHSAFTLWKIVLAWGCLGVFFGIPVLFFGVHLLSIFTNVGLHDGEEFRYMTEFLRTVTAIIISLAGFDTVALFKK